MVKLCKSTIEDIIGIIDGVSFNSECSSKHITKNAFYYGDAMVNNVLTYGPDGKVFSVQ
jgi:hypothetical protein